MTITKAGALISGAGLLAAWLSAAAGTGRLAPVPAAGDRPRAHASDPLATEIRTEAERLHERIGQHVVFQAPSRNPFQFATRAPKPVQAAASPSLAPAPDAAPSTPRVTLAGIAEDAAVRTAIIAGFDQLFLVKEGEPVGTRYRVAKIAADAVELLDLSDGSTLRIALK